MANFTIILVGALLVGLVYFLSLKTSVKPHLHLSAMALGYLTVTLPSLAYIGYAETKDWLTFSGTSVFGLPINVLVLLVIIPLLAIYVWGLVKFFVTSKLVLPILPVIFFGTVIGVSALSLYNGIERSLIFIAITAIISSVIFLLSKLIFLTRFWVFEMLVVFILLLVALVSPLLTSYSFSYFFNLKSVVAGFSYLGLFLVAYDWFDQRIFINKKLNSKPEVGQNVTEYNGDSVASSYEGNRQNLVGSTTTQVAETEQPLKNPQINSNNDQINSLSSGAPGHAISTTANRRPYSIRKLNYSRLIHKFVKPVNNLDSVVLEGSSDSAADEPNNMQVAYEQYIASEANLDKVAKKQTGKKSLVSPDYIIPKNESVPIKKNGKQRSFAKMKIPKFRKKIPKFYKKDEANIGLIAEDFKMPDFERTSNMTQVSAVTSVKNNTDGNKNIKTPLSHSSEQPELITNLSLERTNFGLTKDQNESKKLHSKKLSSKQNKKSKTDTTNQDKKRLSSAEKINNFENAFASTLSQTTPVPKRLAEPTEETIHSKH
ncbi:hypothetical protein H6794_03705 [Candidatus Nomurabacteria bacterium]|nr:hypothetical protein [Candidatus Saccharibacteria bacterium]MCB9839934.1 hypothetical protein [Candidatus Nomurabacteria bacterium]